MSLIQTLKAEAETDLNEMIRDVQTAAANVADEGGVDIGDMLRLACGGRVASVRQRVITKMARVKEKKIVEFYNRQSDIEDATEDGKKSKK